MPNFGAPLCMAQCPTWVLIFAWHKARLWGSALHGTRPKGQSFPLPFDTECGGKSRQNVCPDQWNSDIFVDQKIKIIGQYIFERV
jgi:hypothetical protein